MVGVLRADAALAGNSLRAALNLTLVLITVIGGRIVPAFTGNALRARGAEVTLRRWPAIEGLAVAATLCYAIADTVAPLHRVTHAHDRHAHRPVPVPAGQANRMCQRGDCRDARRYPVQRCNRIGYCIAERRSPAQR